MLLSPIRKTTALCQTLHYCILQDSKRLRTFQVPQQQQIHPIHREVFEDAVLMTLIRLQSGFEKLRDQQVGPSNSVIRSIEMKGIDKLEVETGLGWFVFQGKHQLSTFFYTSPFNGVFKYYYDLSTKRWLSNKDKHIFQENLAREVQGKFSAYLDI